MEKCPTGLISDVRFELVSSTVIGIRKTTERLTAHTKNVAASDNLSRCFLCNLVYVSIVMRITDIITVTPNMQQITIQFLDSFWYPITKKYIDQHDDISRMYQEDTLKQKNIT